VQSPNLGTEVGKQSFNTVLLVPWEQRLEELNRKIEELEKGMEDDILEFANWMGVRWNELRESLRRVTSGNLSTKAQSDIAKKVLIHGETKEKPTDLVLTTLLEVTEVTTKAIYVKIFTPEIVQESCEVEA